MVPPPAGESAVAAAGAPAPARALPTTPVMVASSCESVHARQGRGDVRGKGGRAIGSTRLGGGGGEGSGRDCVCTGTFVSRAGRGEGAIRGRNNRVRLEGEIIVFRLIVRKFAALTFP